MSLNLKLFIFYSLVFKLINLIQNQQTQTYIETYENCNHLYIYINLSNQTLTNRINLTFSHLSNIPKMTDVIQANRNNNETFQIDLKCFSKDVKQVYLRSNNITELSSILRDQKYYFEVKYFQYNHYYSLNQWNKVRFYNVEQIGYLDLKYNLIEIIDERQFILFPFVNDLDLSSNRIIEIKQNAFEGMHSLRRLLLNGNQLIKLHPDAFQNLNELNYIDMRLNNLSKIERNHFRNLSKLSTLELSFNKIYYMESHSFIDLKNLIGLFLNGNQLESIKKENYFGLNNLKILDLSLNKISQIERNSFYHLNNLNRLFLQQNFLNLIEHDSFNYTPNLVEIDLRNNYLNEIQENIFYGLRISSLDLENQRINKMANNSLCGLYKFQYLSIRHNLLEDLYPGQFNCVITLMKLDVSFNRLTKLCTQTFTNVPRLVSLDLSHNLIETIESFTFQKLSSLKELILKNNRLKYLNPYSFTDLNGLLFLNLSRQFITTLKSNTFNGMANLESLDLRLNQIEHIEFGALKNLTKLTDLDLTSNHLKSLNKSHFGDSLISLKVLLLNKNSIRKIEIDTFNHNYSKLENLGLLYNPLEDLHNGSLNGLNNRMKIEWNEFFFDIKSNSLDYLKEQLCYLNKSISLFEKREINKVKYFQSINLIIKANSKINEKSQIFSHNQQNDHQSNSRERIKSRNSKLCRTILKQNNYVNNVQHEFYKCNTELEKLIKSNECFFKLFLVRSFPFLRVGIEYDFDYFNFMKLCSDDFKKRENNLDEINFNQFKYSNKFDENPEQSFQDEIRELFDCK